MSQRDKPGQPIESTGISMPLHPERGSFAGLAGEKNLSREALKELLRSVLERGMPFRFRAKGRSMIPFILDGDVVTIMPLAGRAPRRGDVVAYVQPNTGKVVVHRVVGRERAGDWIIKADCSKQPERGIPRANLLGRVTRVERSGKRVRSGFGPERLLIPWLTCHPQILAAMRRLWRGARRILKSVAT